MNPLRALLGRSKQERLGPWGERVAARHLRRSGYRVVGRNVRSAMGEIDLLCIAPDLRTLVVVEVKTRRAPEERTPHTPRPEDAITRAKGARLIRLAQLEAKRRGMVRAPLRVDVVAIERPEKGPPTVRHHVSAVTP